MRLIFQGEVVAEGATATKGPLEPNMQGEGWRLWDGILRCVNSGGADATVSVVSVVTGEKIEPTVVAAGTGKSSNTLKIPGQYLVEINNVGVGGAILDVYLDGDT